MDTVATVKQEWQTQALEIFMQLVGAPDGDLGKVGRLSNTINDDYSLKLMVEFLSRTTQGRRAFQERPRLGKVALQELHQLPENTLGYAYSHHMIENNLTPFQLGETEDDYSFLLVHIVETHDIWHALTGCDTEIIGEIELQAFYAAQHYASRFWLALLAKNLLKAAIDDIEVGEQYMDALTGGWLRGKQARPLFGIDWKALWETPLENLRTEFNLNRPM